MFHMSITLLESPLKNSFVFSFIPMKHYIYS